jgi:hypothetical protein
MATTGTKTINPWEWDVLDDKDVEKYLSGLHDVSEQAESSALNQPALGRRED